MIDLRLGDCLEIMPTLAAQSFDAIIADIPYGTTACKWDVVIPFAPMWEQLKRLAKPKAAIVLFGSQPFTSALVMSNPDWFRYEWHWRKEQGTGFQLAKYRPLVDSENIDVFSANGHTYNPQMIPLKQIRKQVRKGNNGSSQSSPLKYSDHRTSVYSHAYPVTTIEFCRDRGQHPTQKPVALMEYLVRTYTNEGDTVLDFTAGSGTTGVACVNTNRNAVLIEKEPEYFAIMQRRIAEAQAQLTLPLYESSAQISK